jgi:hypothetical protein
MRAKVYRAAHVAMLALIVIAIGFLDQWFEGVPECVGVIERAYFQGITVPVCYFWFRYYGWLKN